MTRTRLHRRIIWDKGGNPVSHVSRVLDLTEADVGAAIHSIKAAARLRGADNIVIYDNGDVTDARGEEIGNLYDED
ncbi:hypothetical protein FV218_16955 [Methylobacterium sp. WL69]|uniref:hypothetical protein n=1 Tax=Methylobacterium sp. WL69 TaxID=2603893 RepID=UPI0011C8B868|nr:hypothetical protein [Methylobacterium sp. WL69]TXM69693.1 hypothetical protein FV218_16955 [Methylobacterium sp. WL69]